MKESVKVAVRRVLASYLEENKNRKTPERFAILNAVYSFNKHFTLQELNERLEKENFRVSRATLYNTINLLMNLHLVMCHRLQACTVYEACYASNNHCHSICTACGKVTEVKADSVVAAVDGTHLNRFRKEGFSLYIYGVCSTCQAKMTRRKKNCEKSGKSNKENKTSDKNENRKS